MAGPSAVSTQLTGPQGAPTQQLCLGGTPFHGEEAQTASLVPGGEEVVETPSR